MQIAAVKHGSAVSCAGRMLTAEPPVRSRLVNPAHAETSGRARDVTWPPFCFTGSKETNPRGAGVNILLHLQQLQHGGAASCTRV